MLLRELVVMAEQGEEDNTGSLHSEPDKSLVATHAAKDNSTEDCNLRDVSSTELILPLKQELSAGDGHPQTLDSAEKRDAGALEESEEEFASVVVSKVLEKVITQMAVDHSHGQGDTAIIQVKGPVDVPTEQIDSQNQGTGDHNTSSQFNPTTGSETIVSTSEEYCNPTEKLQKLDQADKHHNEQIQQDRSMAEENATAVHHDQELSFADDETPAGREYQPNARNREHHPYDRPHDDDDDTPNMDKTSILSSGVLEIKIPPAVMHPYCGNHILPGAMPQGTYYPSHPQGHYPNLHVSQSYPPPSDMLSSHLSHQQTTSLRSTPTQKLMQFPKLRKPTASGKNFLSSEQRTLSRFSQRQKFPPAVARMSTVMTNTRERTERQRMISTYYEERSPSKLLSLDQCINSRPPMPFDLDTPGPGRYSPCNKPLYETNSPKYTFGIKYYERTGGGRTAWAKPWFNSDDNYTTKANFEDRWPSPTHHSSSRSQVGRRLPSKMTYPSFSIGIRSKFSINKRGSENEPSPNEYNPQRADHILYNKAPSFSMTFRHRGTSLWSSSEVSPAPDLYHPRITFTSSKPHRPAFTIQGIRRPKSHALGPHATF